jgi:hypothetical protein
MRLRAHASTKAVRTVVRSKKRLTELETLDATKLDESARAEHEAKTHKHRSTLAECEKRGRTNVVLTNPSASLMKFPSGAGLPGHRVSVTAAGVRARIVVAVLIDADTNDYGKLDDMLRRTPSPVPGSSQPRNCSSLRTRATAQGMTSSQRKLRAEPRSTC